MEREERVTLTMNNFQSKVNLDSRNSERLNGGEEMCVIKRELCCTRRGNVHRVNVLLIRMIIT